MPHFFLNPNLKYYSPQNIGARLTWVQRYFWATARCVCFSSVVSEDTGKPRIQAEEEKEISVGTFLTRVLENFVFLFVFVCGVFHKRDSGSVPFHRPALLWNTLLFAYYLDRTWVFPFHLFFVSGVDGQNKLSGLFSLLATSGALFTRLPMSWSKVLLALGDPNYCVCIYIIYKY